MKRFPTYYKKKCGKRPKSVIRKKNKINKDATHYK